MPMNLWRNHAFEKGIKQKNDFREYLRAKTQWLPTKAKRSYSSVGSQEIQEEEEKVDDSVSNNTRGISEIFTQDYQEEKQKNKEETNEEIKGTIQVECEKRSINFDQESSAKSKDGHRRKKKKGEIKAE